MKKFQASKANNFKLLRVPVSMPNPDSALGLWIAPQLPVDMFFEKATENRIKVNLPEH